MPIKLKPDDISTWIYFQDRFESHTTVLDIFHIKCNVAVMLEMDKFVNASKRNNIQKVKFSCEHPGFLTFHAILFNLSIKSSFSPSPCSCLCPAGSSPSSSSPWTPPSTTCRRRLCRCGQTQRIPFERTKNIFSYCLITQRLFFYSQFVILPNLLCCELACCV